MISFEVPGDPVPWRAPNIVWRKKANRPMGVKPQSTTEYQETVREVARRVMNGDQPMTGPVLLEVQFFFKMPKHMHRKRIPTPRRSKTTRPDLSNLLKAVEDALSSVVYVDDSQVVQVHGIKYHSAQGEPGKLKVTVVEVED